MRQPLGVVAGITPPNFPAMIPLGKAGPALAAGNAFVLKPSERDPSVPVRLAELFIEEIFGPVLCIVRANDFEEAFRLPDEHVYGNSAAIFTRNGLRTAGSPTASESA